MSKIKIKQIVVAQKEVYDDQTSTGKILEYELYALDEDGEVLHLVNDHRGRDRWEPVAWEDV